MTEILVAPTDKTVLYMSRRSELRLTKRRRFPVRNPVTGEVEGTTPGEFVAFRDGQVRIPKSGTVTLVDSLDGGEAEVDAAEVHKWMENHRLFDNQLEGFWRVDPLAPPVSDDEMRALMDAALTLDEEMLREIARQEAEGWGREQILTRVDDALAKIEIIKSQQEEQAKVEPPKKPGPKPKAQPEG
jgi:hypothetical protein